MPDSSSAFTRGWEIVRQCNDALKAKDYTGTRRLLAEYFQLGIARQGQLHSAILSIAVKMAPLCSEFHLVPFLNIWGLENLRSEDSDARTDESGKRIPSLVERMAKAYAYALLFHPDERLDNALESLLFPFLQKKGFVGTPGPQVTPMLATRLIESEAHGRKMTFVSLIDREGNELTAEIHLITTYQHLRYDAIPGMLFDTLQRTSEQGKLRVEAAVVSHVQLGTANRSADGSPTDGFPTAVGYVEHVDLSHDHLHIFDNQSRHFVAEHSRIRAKVGDYVLFTPIIPKTSKFKSAIIHRIYTAEEGPTTFGYRQAKVTFVDNEKGYAAWELLPDADGTIQPIVEADTTAPSYTKGYLHTTAGNMITPSSSATAILPSTLPTVGTTLALIVFLKRGKDGAKHPHVVDYHIV